MWLQSNLLSFVSFLMTRIIPEIISGPWLPPQKKKKKIENQQT